MMKKQISKLPSTLSQYLRLKAREYEMSEKKLSKLIVPESSGSLISSVTYNEKKLSEKKIKKIASFFKDDPIVLTFLAGKIPKVIYEMIIKRKDVQLFLIEIFNKEK